MNNGGMIAQFSLSSFTVSNITLYDEHCRTCVLIVVAAFVIRVV